MIRLTEVRKELYEAGGMEYNIGFFDLVFIAMKELRYGHMNLGVTAKPFCAEDYFNR